MDNHVCNFVGNIKVECVIFCEHLDSRLMFEIETRNHGVDSHLDVTKSLGNLGNVLNDMGKHEETIVQHQSTKHDLDLQNRTICPL